MNLPPYSFPLVSLIICLLGYGCVSPSPQALPSRPNVLFIMVDDLGWKDLRVMGGDFFETPHIDKLAQEGMTFTQSYAGAANCAPSRACLLSGQNTPRHGVYTVGSSERGKSKDRKLIPAVNIDSLHNQVYTLGSLFKEAGYRTGTFGKWHLGRDPLLQGFDVNVGGDKRGNPGKNGYFSPYRISNIEDGPEGEHLCDRLTSEAIEFLRDNKDTSFFLYLPYYSVHTPLLAKEHLIQKYSQKPGNDKGIHTTYAAMVETLDDNVGRLMQELDQLGISQNTFVVFTSDNGGIRAVAPQDPLRAGKGSYYEGGLRVPMFLRWPNIVASGTQTDAPVVNLDFFPTFMEILQINKPELQLDGVSMVPLLSGGTLLERPLYWHFPIYLQAYNPQQDDGRDPLFRTRPGSVIRYGNWKLHHYYEDGGIELYNLAEDIGERNNLAELETEKTQTLLDMLRNWHNETGAAIPTEINPAYDGE